LRLKRSSQPKRRCARAARGGGASGASREGRTEMATACRCQCVIQVRRHRRPATAVQVRAACRAGRWVVTSMGTIRRRRALTRRARAPLAPRPKHAARRAQRRQAVSRALKMRRWVSAVSCRVSVGHRRAPAGHWTWPSARRVNVSAPTRPRAQRPVPLGAPTARGHTPRLAGQAALRPAGEQRCEEAPPQSSAPAQRPAGAPGPAAGSTPIARSPATAPAQQANTSTSDPGRRPYLPLSSSASVPATAPRPW
jgi:hypothetical protein